MLMKFQTYQISILKNINQKIILFKQNMFYYKFNLQLPKTDMDRNKGCKNI